MEYDIIGYGLVFIFIIFIAVGASISAFGAGLTPPEAELKNIIVKQRNYFRQHGEFSNNLSADLEIANHYYQIHEISEDKTRVTIRNVEDFRKFPPHFLVHMDGSKRTDEESIKILRGESFSKQLKEALEAEGVYVDGQYNKKTVTVLQNS